MQLFRSISCIVTSSLVQTYDLLSLIYVPTLKCFFRAGWVPEILTGLQCPLNVKVTPFFTKCCIVQTAILSKHVTGNDCNTLCKLQGSRVFVSNLLNLLVMSHKFAECFWKNTCKDNAIKEDLKLYGFILIVSGILTNFLCHLFPCLFLSKSLSLSSSVVKSKTYKIDVRTPNEICKTVALELNFLLEYCSCFCK